MPENVMQTEHDDHIASENEPGYAESSCSDNELNEHMELHVRPVQIFNCEQTYYPEYVFDSDIKAGDETKTGIEIESTTPSPPPSALPLKPATRTFRQTCCKFMTDL